MAAGQRSFLHLLRNAYLFSYSVLKGEMIAGTFSFQGHLFPLIRDDVSLNFSVPVKITRNNSVASRAAAKKSSPSHSKVVV